MTTTPVSSLLAIVTDTPDAGRLARFYAELTGGEVTRVVPEHGFVQVAYGDITLDFQTVEDYSPPQWPGQEHPQQLHLDFRGGDMEAAVAHAIALGATRAEPQPEGADFKVMLDPDGHPFCLCPPGE